MQQQCPSVRPAAAGGRPRHDVHAHCYHDNGHCAMTFAVCLTDVHSIDVTIGQRPATSQHQPNAGLAFSPVWQRFVLQPVMLKRTGVHTHTRSKRLERY